MSQFRSSKVTCLGQNNPRPLNKHLTSLYSYFVHFLDSNKGVKSCDNINIGSTFDANEIILLVSELAAFETAKPVLYSTILSTGGATKWVKAIPSELETNSF